VICKQVNGLGNLDKFTITIESAENPIKNFVIFLTLLMKAISLYYPDTERNEAVNIL